MLENSTETAKTNESMKEIWNLLNWEDRRFLYNLRSVDMNNKKNNLTPNIGFSEEYILKRFPISSVNYFLLTSYNFISRIDRKDIARNFLETNEKNIEESSEDFNIVYNNEMAILDSTKESEDIRIVATKECFEFFDRFLNNVE